jgi:biotin synthase
MTSSGRFQRVCLQCSDEPAVRGELPWLVGELESPALPVSVSTAPIAPQLIRDLKDAGAERLTIPIDCAREDIFMSMKGRPMADYWTALSHAVEIFGRGSVGTHLIVGLGERERDLVLLMAKLFRKGIIPSLFAFTPVRGTPMETRGQPDLRTYRRMQLARHLMASMGAEEGSFQFDERDGSLRGLLLQREKLEAAIFGGEAFMTQGCPGCNRPYFNERVSGPIFNYPSKPDPAELAKIRGEIVGTLETY